MTRRKFIPTEVKFTLLCREEITPVRGNALASGDDDVDREAEDTIIASLSAGDRWAWCHVTIEAYWAGFTGRDSLGCCSYENEEAFRQRGRYFSDMLQEATGDLINQIREAGWEVDVTVDDFTTAEHHGSQNVEVTYP